MTLLITPSFRGQACATLLEKVTQEKTELTTTLRAGLALLRTGEFSMVVVDESLLEMSPSEADVLVRRMGTAMPVYVNLGVSGTERVVHQLRAALHRRQEEQEMALRKAEADLTAQLRGDLTAVLLASSMALSEPLTENAHEKVASIYEAAARMQNRLRRG